MLHDIVLSGALRDPNSAEQYAVQQYAEPLQLYQHILVSTVQDRSHCVSHASVGTEKNLACLAVHLFPILLQVHGRRNTLQLCLAHRTLSVQQCSDQSICDPEYAHADTD